MIDRYKGIKLSEEFKDDACYSSKTINNVDDN